MNNHTKIVVTLGPACAKKTILKNILKAGAVCVRLNFSHGLKNEHRDFVKTVRQLENELNRPIAILQDLPGPKVRLGLLPASGLNLRPKTVITFNSALLEYDNSEVPIDFSAIPNWETMLKPRSRIMINDGRIEAKIIKVEAGKIFAEIISGGVVSSHKGVNLPNADLEVSALTAKDLEDLKFGLRLGVDAVAMSFVENKDDITEARILIDQIRRGLKLPSGYFPLLIAKIETKMAVKNIKSILEVVDGVMVARGDMGVELPAEQVPLAQKKIVALANRAGKPVIVATQMLDSMQTSPRPTRAEVSDIANAVIDHADALMLSNETATGDYPVAAVKVMSDVIRATEHSHYDDQHIDFSSRHEQVDTAITELSRVLAEKVDAKLILAASLTGETGRLISQLRPRLPIYVATSSQHIQRQLLLSWGVNAFILGPCKTIEKLIDSSADYLQKAGILKKGDKMIVVAGEPVGEAGKVNLVEVREVK